MKSLVRFVSSTLLGVFFLHSWPAVSEDPGTEIDPEVPYKVGCKADETGAAALLQVQNIRDIKGNLRAQVYGSNPDDFLEKGKKLVRIDNPVLAYEQELCIPLPGAGKYALVVMHDRNANGKADIFSEGFGFSNNPKLGLSKPDAEEVMIEVLPGVNAMPITLTYLFNNDDDQKKKRRLFKHR